MIGERPDFEAALYGGPLDGTLMTMPKTEGVIPEAVPFYVVDPPPPGTVAAMVWRLRGGPPMLGSYVLSGITDNGRRAFFWHDHDHA